jgi:ubiquinone/menaquinone biosynthesis C-methylase UbiE
MYYLPEHPQWLTDSEPVMPAVGRAGELFERSATLTAICRIGSAASERVPLRQQPRNCCNRNTRCLLRNGDATLVPVPRSEPNRRFLTPQQASRVYDRIGRFQDWQFVYEGAAIRELVRLGSFETAQSVFEFGCGTGAFAGNLLKTHLRLDCRYVGVDVSPKMVRLATSRVRRWPERAAIRLSDGSSHLHEPDSSFDRFISNYVFDLLAPDYATAIIAEAKRILSSGGKLCMVSLARGTSGLSRIMTAFWETMWRLKSELVGGCRPVDLRSLLTPEQWNVDHHQSVVSFGITSDVIVASRR